MSIIKTIKDKIKGIPGTRSPKWQTVRKKFIEANPECALCGSLEKVEIHHKKPFHLHPELELDVNNLIGLCESGKNGIICHRAFGHLGDYKSFNKNIDEDIAAWKQKINNRPKE